MFNDKVAPNLPSAKRGTDVWSMTRNGTPQQRSADAAADQRVRSAVAQSGRALAEFINNFKTAGQARADIGGVKDQITAKKDQLTLLKGQPRTAEVLLRTDKAQRALRGLQAQLQAIHARNDPVIIQAKIDKAKTKITDMETLLRKLKAKSPQTQQVKADIKTLEAAIRKAKKKLAELDRLKVEADITARDYATAQGERIRQALIAKFATPINAVVNFLYRASGSKDGGSHWGGTVSGPHGGYPHMLHGTETIVAHDHPGRGLADLAKYGILRGGGGGGGPSINIDMRDATVVGIEDLAGYFGEAMNRSTAAFALAQARG